MSRRTAVSDALLRRQELEDRLQVLDLVVQDTKSELETLMRWLYERGEITEAEFNAS